ncbi:MAG TPA: hypothetical protein EYP56_22445 [Planctomycetaceae bacterium]|nr:hypothetical protein [Planctomycetaceae bacterium]
MGKFRSRMTGGMSAGTLLLATLLAGCSATRHYRAADCPPELLAPPVQNAQTVDLSRFAGPPADSERIERGDVLEVSIAAGLDAAAITRFPVRVGEDGNGIIPELGPVPLAGLKLMGAEQVIAAACVHRGLFRQPQVTVTMKERGTNRITVLGAVEEPGVYELPRGSSYLMSALVAAGGLAEDAGTVVEIRRPLGSASPGGTTLASFAQGTTGPRHAGRETTSLMPEEQVRVARVDLASEILLGPQGKYLEDGSVVRVERRHPEPIQVIGLVKKPGQYELPVNHEVRVLGAIAMAGGLTQQVADKVYVIRNPAGEPNATAVIEVSLRKAKRNLAENIRLAPGDTVSVEHTPLTVLMEVINVIRFGIGGSFALY